MSTVPKLYYFDIPGKGEAIRLACAYAGYEIEDIRLNQDEFLVLKETGKLPFGQLPVLDIGNGRFIAQSAAIMRYVGKITNLYPKDDYLASVVDSIIDEESDLFTGLGVSRYTARFGFGFLDTNPALVCLVRDSLNSEILPRHLHYLENFVANSSSGWIANTDGPSIADFVLVPRLQWLTSGVNDGISTHILDKFPHLVQLISRLLALPAIANYYGK